MRSRAGVWNVRAAICGVSNLVADARLLAASLYEPAAKKSIFQARGRMKNKQIAISMLVLLLSLALNAVAQKPDAAMQVSEGIESRSQANTDVALQIWKFAETGFQEVESSALLEARLAEAGFSVHRGVYNIRPNAYLADLQRKNMQKIGGIKYTGANKERGFAEALRRTMLDPVLPLGSEEAIQPPEIHITPASTDLGDVSWNVPIRNLQIGYQPLPPQLRYPPDPSAILEAVWG